MTEISILSHSGFPYPTNGFQSLSGKRALQLRTGSSLKQPQTGKYLSPKWCPKLDILAVPEGRALRLVRLSGGETIWRRTLQDSNQTTSSKASDTGKEAIRAIAWDPAGHCIAVLHSEGSLVQRDAAHGDIVHESRIELADGEMVASMLWVSCDNDDEQSTGIMADEKPKKTKAVPLEFSLPALGPLDRSKATPSNINSEPDTLTAIIVITTRGAVWITLGGIFTLPVARLPHLQGDSCDHAADFMVADAQISRNMSTLYIYLNREQGEQNGSCLNAAICTLDTSMLAAATPLLRSLAYLSARISGLFLYIENAIELAISEANDRNETASRVGLMQTFERILQDHGVDGVTSPEAELCRLAVTGKASEPTSQFLLAKLKATKLKSWENSGRQGAVAIARIIYQYVSPAIERTILATSRFLQIVTADISQLSLAGYHFGSNSSSNSNGGSASVDDMAETRSLIMHAIVILGWMYSRFEEYAARLQEEQRENQAFVDWALLAVDDLNWQNEGIHKAGNDDSADDGLRPIRPEMDYKLLLKFIRSAFRRRSSDYDDDGAPDEQAETLNILSLKEDRSKADNDIVQAYFDVLGEHANLETVQRFQLISAMPYKGSGVTEFPFHSTRLLDEATERYTTDSGHRVPPPTCREALVAAKSLTSRALEWPSAVLGNGLQWNSQSAFAYFSPTMRGGGDATVGRISDMRCIANATSDGDLVHSQGGDAGTMYLAVASAESHALEILALPRLSSGGEVEVRSALIRLAVKTRSAESQRSEMDRLSLRLAAPPPEETKDIRVTGVSFFDDDQLGIAFAIDGYDSSYLGTISYRQGKGNISYSPVSKYTLDHVGGNTTSDISPPLLPLEFTKLLRLDGVSSPGQQNPVSVSTNGRPGRRSIAVVEQRGKYWWPYDMDNSEDEDDDDEDL
ncbi:hypothetical protein EV175_002479 [Coemansia sp. RSA 1933]|nr:hypothetical protein EV175_002479 [Coemansia sp. RSA 1933]